MLGRPYTAKDGTTKPLALEDFLFIAPYNAQVRALKSGPAERRPGRQRRQIPRARSRRLHPFAVLQLRRIRLARLALHPRSFPDQRRHLPRQMLGVVVGDPRIANSAAGSIGEMKLLNLYCKLMTQNYEPTG